MMDKRLSRKAATGLILASVLTGACQRMDGPVPEAGMSGGSRRPQAIATLPPTPPPRPAIKAADAALLSAAEVKPATASGITISTTAFPPDGKIPYRYSDYGEKISPDLTIGNVPPNAKSLVLLAEDPDAVEPKPFIHWVLYNLPPGTTHLPEAIPGALKLADFGDALQGANSSGSIGYDGMRPPYGSKAHHFHFQIFALDTMLDLPPGADRSAVRAAMDKHVISSGEIVGTYLAGKY